MGSVDGEHPLGVLGQDHAPLPVGQIHGEEDLQVILLRPHGVVRPEQHLVRSPFTDEGSGMLTYSLYIGQRIYVGGA